MRKVFSDAARWVSEAVGTPLAFMAAVAFVVGWALTGPVFLYSPQWQLVINTGTTIVTFLMVFVIQNAQNRDQRALQLKLDELLRATKTARTGFADIENLDDETLKQLQAGFASLHEKHGVDVEKAVKLVRSNAREAAKVVEEQPETTATKPIGRRRARSSG